MFGSPLITRVSFLARVEQSSEFHLAALKHSIRIAFYRGILVAELQIEHLILGKLVTQFFKRLRANGRYLCMHIQMN